MLKGFNSFQLVSLFAAFPFAISWLNQATFSGAQAAVWVACAAYVFLFGWMCVMVYDANSP